MDKISLKYHLAFYFILLIMFLSCSPSEPESSDYICLEEIECTLGTNTSINSENYYCNDLVILQDFINANTQTYRHYLDQNANGCIEPLEFGVQTWKDHRLFTLDLSYHESVIIDPNDPTKIDETNHRLSFFPEGINGLDSLETLKLNDNEFSSLSAEITQLINLKKIEITNNFLSNLPLEIGSLIHLEELIINDNDIGYFPESIKDLQSLKKIYAQNNSLYFIPNSLGNLTNLEWLYLNNNDLDDVPSSLKNLESLQMLNLDDNNLTTLPDELCESNENGQSIFTESELFFSANNNEICPKRCMDFSNESDCHADCEWVINSENGLGTCNGEANVNQYPNCISGTDIGNQTCGNCPPLHWSINNHCVYEADYEILQNFIDLNPESLIGGMRASDCYNTDWWDTFMDASVGYEKSRLVEITFLFKELTSEIPTSLSGLEELKILRLEGNSLSGSIPDELTTLEKLEVLRLNKNSLSGEIPSNIGLLTNLDSLWINGNQLEGSLPQSLTNLTNLTNLRLDENNLSGSIPENIGNMSSLKYLRIDNNNLSGEIPESIGNLINLRRIYLLNNNMTGEIPESLCNLPHLFWIYLHNNQFCPGINGYPDCLLNAVIEQQNTINCP